MKNTTHEIKTHPESFRARWQDMKPWEFRLNDRGYSAGDHLHEREYLPAPEGSSVSGVYTGFHILSRVMWVFNGGKFGIPNKYCIMTVETISKGKWLPRAEKR